MNAASPSLRRLQVAASVQQTTRFSQMPKLTVVHESMEFPVVFSGENYTIEAKLLRYLINKESLGLGNVDNTSDLDKPISTAVQDALDELFGRLQDKANTADLNALSARVGVAERKIADLELFANSGIIPADRVSGLNPVIDARIDLKIDGIVAPTVFAGPNDW